MRGRRTRTRALLLAFVLVVTVGCNHPTPLASKQPEPTPPPPAIENFFDYNSFSDVIFFAARIIFTLNHDGRGDIYRVLTDYQPSIIVDCPTASCRAHGFSTNSFLYSRTQNGTTRIYTHTGGAPNDKELPGQDGTAEKFVGLITDGSRFYTGGNGRDERAFDLYEWDAITLKPRLVFKNDLKRPFFIGPLSPDGAMVALVRNRGDKGDELRIRNLRTGRNYLVPVVDHDLVEPLFFLEGTLYYLAYDGDDRRGIMRFKPGDRAAERFLFDPIADFRFASPSQDARWNLILTIKSRDGSDKLEIYDPRGNRTPLSQPIKGQISWASLFAKGKLIVYLMGGETSPSALYLQGPATSVRNLFEADFKLSPEMLTSATSATISARDGLTLPALLYKPTPDTDPVLRRPAVIWLHGGPGGEARREYSPGIQYLVSRGYVVLALNYRGSSGYGRAFMDADNRRHGHEDVDDVIDARDWLAGQDFVDPEKIAVVGRSYGGYLTLAALARAPEKFAAGVDLFGPSNWVTALTELPPEARVFLPSLYAEIGDPVADRQELLAISPVNFADRIRGPLLIVQGAADGRVSSEDTTELVRHIREHMGWVEYVYFATEGHGFGNVQNEIRCWDRVREFLDLHLRGIKPPAPKPAPQRPPVFAQ